MLYVHNVRACHNQIGDARAHVSWYWAIAVHIRCPVAILLFCSYETDFFFAVEVHMHVSSMYCSYMYT